MRTEYWKQRFQRQEVILGNEEVKDLRGQGLGWLMYLVVDAPRLMAATVLKRNTGNQELPIFKEQGQVMGG